MAYGGSSMSTSRTTPSSMPVMPSPSTATGQIQSPRNTLLLQPHEHRLDRTSFETLTSVASSNPASSANQLRRPGLGRSAHSYGSERDPTNVSSHSRPRTLLMQHHQHRSCSSLPPMRDLPPLHTSHAEVHWQPVHWQPSLVDADQLLEGPSDDEEEMTPNGLDLSLGSLNGFPYNMGVPDAMEERSRYVAEAEEEEYQKEKKQKARLSARVSHTLKNARSFSWNRRGQR